MAKTGAVKFFNGVKGFGFIVQDDGGEDLFAHRNNIADGQDLVEGDAVRYDEDYDDRKGKTNAVNVTGGTGCEVGAIKGISGGKSGGKGFGGGSGYKGGGKGFGDGKGFSGGGKAKGKGKAQANTIFVGGLSWDTTSGTLRTCFEEAAEIMYAAVMTDRETGRSKGCGKVEFANEAGMEYAIANWNQTELDGRTISVKSVLDTLSIKASYSFFGFQEDTAEKELDNAYRQLAKRMHPDKNGGTQEAKEKFQLMKEHYEAIKRHRAGDGAQAHRADDGGPEEECGIGPKAENRDEQKAPAQASLSELLVETQRRPLNEAALHMIGVLKNIRSNMRILHVEQEKLSTCASS